MKFVPNTSEIAKIPEPFRTDWAKALRSSKQYKDRLYDVQDPEAMCCLGVACQVAGLSLGDMTSTCQGTSLSHPPQKLTAIIGLDLEQLTVTDKEPFFTNLNDSYFTHPQIADLLDGITVEID